MITVDLEPAPPFRLDLTVWALRRRPGNAIDCWDGTTYRRVLILNGAAAVVAVTQVSTPDAPRLRVVVDGIPNTSNVAPAVMMALESLLGLRVDLSGFYEQAAGDPKLGDLVERFRGVKPPRFPTVFEALLNAIACQQMTLTQGIRFLSLLAEAHGPISAGGAPTIHALPGPAELAIVDPESLRGLGFSRQKARALVEAAHATLPGRFDLDELATLDDAEAVARLRELRGIGRWSAEYVLLRGLGRTHIFPGDDVGARNNLQGWLGRPGTLDYDGVGRAVAPWHPYAGLVYFHLLLDRLAERGYLSEPSALAFDRGEMSHEKKL